jgi:hypothetical protein
MTGQGADVGEIRRAISTLRGGEAHDNSKSRSITYAITIAVARALGLVV